MRESACNDGVAMDALVAWVGVLSLIVGGVCGMVWHDLKLRRAAMDQLITADAAHKSATESLMALHNKAVTEHAALMEKVGSLEHMLANRNQGPLVRSFK